MYTETTLYIRNELLQKLDYAAETMNISRSVLVSILLMRYMKANQAGNAVFTRLKYQARDSESAYTTRSLCLRKDVYEMWCDVRKAFKLSASLLIALAIELYLDELLKGDGLPDNYVGMYATNTTYHANACVIQIIWGKLEEKTLEKLTFG